MKLQFQQKIEEEEGEDKHKDIKEGGEGGRKTCSCGVKNLAICHVSKLNASLQGKTNMFHEMRK